MAIRAVRTLVVTDKVVMADPELSGFMPCYWDYVVRMNANPYDELWTAEIDKFLDPYPRYLK